MKITIKTRAGDKEVEATGVRAVPGLVVNRLEGGGWGVTHKASGYLVHGGSFKTKDEARDAARSLAGAADWTQPADRLGDMAELGRKVRTTLFPWLYEAPAPRESVIEPMLPDGWELEGDDLDGLLVCPHGAAIEMDGVCPRGCVSPLRTAGLI